MPYMEILKVGLKRLKKIQGCPKLFTNRHMNKLPCNPFELMHQKRKHESYNMIKDWVK